MTTWVFLSNDHKFSNNIKIIITFIANVTSNFVYNFNAFILLISDHTCFRQGAIKGGIFSKIIIVNIFRGSGRRGVLLF